jgi:hypothetical protein
VVNPSEADELIFGGRNLDKSGEDKRDFLVRARAAVVALQPAESQLQAQAG